MSVTCHRCGIPLAIEERGYTPCTCAEDAARARRVLVTIGELDPQPEPWPYPAPAAWRVELDMRACQILDSERGARTFDSPAATMIASHDRLVELGGKGESYVLRVCETCHELVLDPYFPCPAPTGENHRCHQTGRFSDTSRASRVHLWAKDLDQAKRLAERVPHHDKACVCNACGTRRIAMRALVPGFGQATTSRQ